MWVIDTKRYKGKVTIRKPLFGEAKLTIAGRDKTTLIDALADEVKLIAAVTPTSCGAWWSRRAVLRRCRAVAARNTAPDDAECVA
ncbi:MAG: hypothetical protein LC777_22010 [Actinobacteria bacterium]|nr:hypothetical protein [Actinomycetota bacterium]